MTTSAARVRRNARLLRYLPAAIAVASLLVGCDPEPPEERTLTLDGEAMGTAYRVTVPRPLPVAVDALSSAVAEQLEQVDALMSTYREDSELSALNRHESADAFPVSPQTFAVLAAAQEVSEATSGAFDITVGPLVEAWGFGPSATLEAPAPDVVARLRRATGWQKLTLDEASQTVQKSSQGIQCDLSAIAKGYAVDQVARAIEGLGCRDYMVDVGGEVRLAGLNAAGKRWRIGVERPDAVGRVVHRILQVTDTGVATSGDYRNFRMEAGRRLSHVLDPRIGEPVDTGVASATVLHGSTMRADAFATAFLVLGEREGIAVAEREGLAVLLLIRDGDGGFREVTSSRFRALYSVD